MHPGHLNLAALLSFRLLLWAGRAGLGLQVRSACKVWHVWETSRGRHLTDPAVRSWHGSDALSRSVHGRRLMQCSLFSRLVSFWFANLSTIEQKPRFVAPHFVRISGRDPYKENSTINGHSHALQGFAITASDSSRYIRYAGFQSRPHKLA